MIYLLDTNAVSDLMRAEPRIDRWIAQLETTDRVMTCTIVRGEILFGIARLPNGTRRAELESAGRQLLAAFRCEAIPENAGDSYASLKVARRQRGLVLDENDLWIAATAVALGATLVSRDTDLAGIEGLAVVDWTKL